MIPKRFLVPLAAALAVVALPGACVLWVATREDPDVTRFKSIREGMTESEAMAVMFRKPDLRIEFSRARGPDRKRQKTGELILSWDCRTGTALVDFGPNRRVVQTRWRDPDPFWEPLRRWLRR